jgi:hypothetical protein
MDWESIILSLVVGLGGGVAGAIVSNRFQDSRERQAQRLQAKHALMTFQRTLGDKAISMWHDLGYTEDRPSFAKVDWSEVRAARNDAYLYRHYLEPADRQLIESTQIFDDGAHDNDSTTGADSLAFRSSEIEKAIAKVFRID